MSLILKSVEEEAADCRARCSGMKIGDPILHCHHNALCEALTEPVENRISYILTSKQDNRALRLRLMGPPIVDAEILADAEWVKASDEYKKASDEYKKADAAWNKARAELSKANAEWRKTDAEWYKAAAEWKKAEAEWYKAYEPHYARLYPDSPWNGQTIFAGKFKL